MIVITCEDGRPYGFHFATPANQMRIVDGRVEFTPHLEVKATLEFPSPVVSIKEEGE